MFVAESRASARSSNGVKIGFVWLAFVGPLLTSPPGLLAQGEAYYLATGGLSSGSDSFVDTWCGPDMLPYTSDDLALPEGGNAGGTWGFAWIDLQGDGVVDEDEPIFSLIRRGDDDVHSLSTKSYPQYGVLAESQNWIDYHEARNAGPSGADPATAGNDFEHNDRPRWEDESNYYAFNNAKADQRGAGGSKYYFEHRNGEGLDEIEGFQKYLSFQHNMDDPATAFDERGACRESYMQSTEAVTKGLCIPVQDIPTLETGSLDPLFGWYSGDMADYVREVLGPKLEDAGLTVFEATSGCSQSGLPPTHVLILQIACPITINGNGACSSIDTAKTQAAYWGILPEDPACGQGGETSCATSAIYRVSHVLLLDDELTRTEMGIAGFSLEPEDGVARNLWVQDDFWRANTSVFGRYVLDGNWAIVDDTSLDHGCAEFDKRLELAAGIPGFFEAPLSAPLDPAEGAVLAVAELGDATLFVEGRVEGPVEGRVEGIVERRVEGDGVGADADTVYQIILLDGTEVVAWAAISRAGTSVSIGGVLDTDGLAESPSASSAGEGGAIPFLDPADTAFTRFVLRASASSIQLLQAEGGDYDPRTYTGMDGYTVLATLARGVTTPVTQVRVATSGGPEFAPAVDGFAVFSNLDPDPVVGVGPFVRGDANADGTVNVTDGIFVFNHLFLGGAQPPCTASADANRQGQVNVTSGIFILNFLFLGGPSPPLPSPNCGRSIEDSDGILGCVDFPACN